MGNQLANSFIGTGQAVAFSRGMSPERMAERSSAYAEKEARDQELRNLKATEPTEADRKVMAEQQSLALQNALETQKQLLVDNNKQTTFRAYERFDADGDLRHINTMLTDLDSRGSKLYGKIARVDKIVEEDRSMLQDMGFPPALVDAMINDPELNKSYVRITQKDGTKSFGDLDALKGVTRYTEDYANVNEVKRQETARMMENLAIMGYDLDPLGREAFRRTKATLGPNVDPKSPEFQNAYTEMYDKLQRDKRRRGGATASIKGASGENKTEAEAYGHRIAIGKGFYPGDEGYEEELNIGMQEYVRDIRPSAAIKNDEYAATAEEALTEMGFMDMSLDNLSETERVKIEQNIRKLEGPGGQELSIEDRKTLARIRKLTTLGDKAAELTAEQTGVIDSVMRTVKKYVSDDIEGVEAESAYQNFRNLVLHSFYGSALTPTEAENLQKAFGSLKQQRGPVLEQLKTTMLEIKDAYEAIEATNNDMVIKWRAGKTGADLYAVIDSLDERIQYIDSISKGDVTPYTTEIEGSTVLTPEIETKLDNIFGENG